VNAVKDIPDACKSVCEVLRLLKTEELMDFRAFLEIVDH